ncbi:MAG: carboxypeptidase regulatory-like domain-containing protein [Planctomycetaceae bacterium]
MSGASGVRPLAPPQFHHTHKKNCAVMLIGGIPKMKTQRWLPKATAEEETIVAARTRRIPAVLVAAFAVWGAGAVPAPAEDEGSRAEETTLTGSLSGQAVDREGEPLIGVSVTLYLDDIDAEQRHYGKLRDVTTAADGAYEFADLPAGWYLVVPEKEGLARSFRYFVLEEGAELSQDFVLRMPVPSVVTVRDEDGPVAGARLRMLEVRDDNGEVFVRRRDEWELFDMTVPPSDENGRLRLPELPEGSVFTATIDHDDLAPVEVKDVKAGPETTTEVIMKPGVTVALKIAGDEEGGAISEATINLHHEPFSNPSSMIAHTIPVDEGGIARVTIEPGRYRMLWLRHEDYLITPLLSPNITKGEYLRIGDSANEEFLFTLHRKVQVHGRVVDASGKPMAKILVQGEVPNVGLDGTMPDGESDWMHTGWCETDEQGYYTLDVAAGRSRITGHPEGYVIENGSVELAVAADGSTMAPDLTVHPLPTVVGKVVDANGHPVAGAVVRFRGGLRHMQPTKTDDEGRFTLKPTWMPTDTETDQQQPKQPLVAFHPHERLGASTTVALNKPDSLGDLTLTLEPQEPQAFLDGYREESTPAERGEVDEEILAEKAQKSLIGQPAPSLDGTWLNIDEPSEGLAAFRGKYVLLDFWFVGCGPCHADFPSVQLLHDLYKDHGVVVIAVHNNSSTADAVRQFAGKEGMTVPILVDEPDGPTIARYEGRGLSGYPSHLLIGPDGTVIDDDRTTPGPSLRTYKIELIRERLLE